MPTLVVGLLVVLVGLYVILAGAAWMGVLWSRRALEATPPSNWPSVSVVVLPSTEFPEATMQALQECDYPPEQLDIVLMHSGSVGPALENEHGDLSVRFVSAEAHDRNECALEKGLDAARGEVVLTLPPHGTVSSSWIRAMVRHCTDDTAMVVGPTAVEHDNLFWPRLQALHHLWYQAFSGGLSQFGLPLGPSTQNRAVRPRSLSSEPDGRSAPKGTSAVFAPDPDAVARRAPVSSFIEYVRWQAHWLIRSVQFPARLVQGRAVGLWLLHAALLACSVVAVGLPSWREPTLLALVGKMGADVILTLPVAKLYGQRGLLRSIVPTELMLVLAIPIAGLWTLVNLNNGSEFDAPMEDLMRES